MKAVAVCCSVLQCVGMAVRVRHVSFYYEGCCSVLQCVGMALCVRQVTFYYGVALLSRIDKSISLFCKRAL